MAGILEQSALDGIDRLYIMQEPDAGGTAFLTHIARKLEAWQWQGKAFAIRLAGAKDPSALHQQGRQGFRTTFQRALEQAEPLFLRSVQTVSASTEVPKPAIFSLQDLLSWELPPMRWAIPEILPEGLTLLVGKPKLGKSWLALSVALSIAAGGRALGTQPVTQGDILYLALEDNARRLQARARQLLASMEGVPSGMDFALDWPRLGAGGLGRLEDYLKTHPSVRLVVIDTWAKIAPPSGERRCTQYEGDYESLTPLKHLADTYHVSMVAVHHLRKTGSTDVLDEITGSTGLTGAVDGMLILKRERGQAEASLFVTGRDVEHEQHLALTFDTTTAQWRLIGNTEEVGRTRARQEILDLLREQQSDGMSPREIAEVLDKNYHTTRSLLRKMKESGEVGCASAGYVSLFKDTDQVQERSWEMADQQPKITDQRKHIEQPPRLSLGVGDATDATDYVDDSDANDEGASSQRMIRQETASSQEIEQAMTPHDGAAKRVPTSEHEETAVISVINHHQRHQTDALTLPAEIHSERLGCADRTMQIEQHNDGYVQKDRCPHHPRERQVRFDPAGQAWCDRLDCWDCYRLMKIGEALGYRCLADQGSYPLITQGMESWATFVLSQRPFTIVLAIQEALALCQALGIEVPELSGEETRVGRADPMPL